MEPKYFKPLLIFSALLSLLNNIKGQSSISFVQPPPGSIILSNLPSPTSIKSHGINDQVDNVSCYMPNSYTQVWCINKPNVTRYEVGYPEIIFKKGDVVSVAAGGGVQTGGHGLTWKRYVEPIGAYGGGDDNNYYGLINIPNVIPTQKLLTAIENGPFSVNTDPGTNAYLRLLYKDNHYEDNGYWNHDAGWYEQCWNMKNAWVIITIKHNCAGSNDPGCILPAPMDVVSNEYDLNSLPFNPTWGFQRTAGIRPQPSEIFNFSFKDAMSEDNTKLGTRQKTSKDEYWACIKGGTWGGIEGHINWMPVTYTGAIAWSDHGLEDRAGDDDYNLHLWTNNQAGYTTENSYLQLEYNAGEVMDKCKSRWWHSFQQAVDKQDNEIRLMEPSRAYADDFFLDKKTGLRDSAIIIGLFGIDFEHGQGLTELHPLYVFAVHTKKDPNDDVWAFFARNWGNEGWCGRSDHLLSLTTISLLLSPPYQGFTNPQIISGPNFTEVEFSKPGMSFSLLPKTKGAQLILNLLSPSEHSLIDGEIHLKWDPPQFHPRSSFQPPPSSK